MNELPVVVVGAGPIGLAAAAQLREQGLPLVLFERGPVAGHAVGQWNHVRLFSRWAELIDRAARRLLDASGWIAPDDDAFPTGVTGPATTSSRWRLRWGRRSVSTPRWSASRAAAGPCRRRGTCRGTTIGPRAPRRRQRVRHPGSRGDRCVGTWTTPNPLGAEGLPAAGEHAAKDRIAYRVPDFADPSVRGDHAGKHTVIAGSGHSALTAIVALAALAAEEPGTRISWVLRRGEVGSAFGGGDADRLPARGALGQRAEAALEAGLLQVVSGFRTARVESDAAGVALISDVGDRLDHVDRVVVLTGFRPDLSWLSEVRLGLDPVLQAPVRLAPLIDPNVHSCGSVYPHGIAELAHPEPNLFLAGMKSYGRAPTFLAMTGYEQVRSIAAGLAGDHESAARVELTLPETRVCGGAGVFDEPEGSEEPASPSGCCGATTDPQLISVSAR